MAMHPDDIEVGLSLTIRRQRTRQRAQYSQELDYFHSFEPATVTDVDRSKSGRVRAVCARNEATRRTYWYTVRIVLGSGQTPAPIVGYFRRGSSVTSGYELLLQPFSAFADAADAR